jgi:hypothetical protein
MGDGGGGIGSGGSCQEWQGRGRGERQGRGSHRTSVSSSFDSANTLSNCSRNSSVLRRTISSISSNMASKPVLGDGGGLLKGQMGVEVKSQEGGQRAWHKKQCPGPPTLARAGRWGETQAVRWCTRGRARQRALDGRAWQRAIDGRERGAGLVCGVRVRGTGSGLVCGVRVRG